MIVSPNTVNHGLTFLIAPIFALVWFLADIYWATAALMSLLTLQVILLKIFSHPVPKFMWITLLLAIVLGTLTLLLQDKVYVQMKTTVVYFVFALVLLVSDFLLKKNLITLMLEKSFAPPPIFWRRLSTFMAILFFILGVTNWLVVSFLSEATWVIIKTAGFPAILIIFSIFCGVFLMRHAKPEQCNE